MLLAGVVAARGGANLTTLVHFGGTNASGSNPGAALLQTADGNLYGTLERPYNGTNTVAQGTGFRLTTNGLLTLFNINGGSYYATTYSSWAQRTYDGNLYCVDEGHSLILEYNTNGASGLPLFPDPFDGTNGDNPTGLAEGTDGNFYGTTTSGGISGSGTIFQVTFNGRITSLYSFTGGSDGANPLAPLVQASNGNFYGTTAEGGWNNAGTVFSVTTNGILTSLYSFTGGEDGYYPAAGLVQGSDGYLYGTTEYGGAFNVQNEGCGTVFKIATNGLLTTLFSFNGTNGANPVAPLIQAADGNLYGTTAGGGNTNILNTIYANEVRHNIQNHALWRFHNLIFL